MKLSSLIKLEKVTKHYTLGTSQFVALTDTNFQLAKGEMTAIMGASGSGKSTLMNIIGFLDCATSGRYWFDGQEVSHLQSHELAKIRNQQIGFIFQSFFLLPRFTALQNVMLPLFYRGLSEKLAKEQALSLLEKVGLAHVALHRPNQLSGGQQQRVAIARALIGKAQLILADEPTGALDSTTGNDIMQLLKRLHEEGTTILIITHDKEISRRCERVVTIKDGQIQ
jgi:putative ABC transport system ATP-binding protein